MGNDLRSEIELARTSIGQEGATGNVLAVSLATAQLVNSRSEASDRSALTSPRVIEGYCAAGRLEQSELGGAVGKPLPAGVADSILDGMRGAVAYGTAVELSDAGRALAAKTGTADTSDPTYPVNSWITAVIDNRWVLTVVVHTASDGAQASSVADDLIEQFPASFSEPSCS
ncbi:hypothetical protein BJF84_10465 [Rhodococcus sp. CUA-806]|nr:hypothetical protein BJF84_10465 [Rhodococcus sp. CUA-806]